MAKAQSLKDLIHIVMTGTPQEAKAARKEIDSRWPGITRITERQKWSYEILVDAIKDFDAIENPENQTVFIYVLQWPFMLFAEQHFERFGDFILRCIQSPSGKVRQAVLHMTDWLTMGFDIWPRRFMLGKKLDKQTLNRLESNRRRYFSFVQKVEELAEKYSEPKYKKFGYIHTMPPGIYKSFQYLLMERLLRTEEYEREYDRFLEERNLPIKNGNSSIVREAEAIVARSGIVQRREEIERELEAMLRKAKSEWTLEKIKAFIYEENDENDSFKRLFAIFDRGQDMKEIENIIDILTDAWNYFPHKALDGKSPQEMLLEYRERC